MRPVRMLASVAWDTRPHPVASPVLSGMNRSGIVVCLLLSASLLTADPYTDPAQLDVPWPKHSHFKQPWRGYLETRSGADFLSGIGINYHVPEKADELAVRLLSETGFRTFRVEIGWGSVRYDEQGLSNEKRHVALAKLMKQYGIRPTFLLNAHQGVPCPVLFFNRKLVEDAPKGSTSVKLADVKDLVIGRSGISGLSEYWAAEALITAIDEKSGVCTLSKPLPKDLKAGNVSMATLKYLPLYPVGTKEFDETAEGWVKYALMICKLAKDAGIEQFDIEIWNELTFGTRFLRIDTYYEKGKSPAVQKADFLNPGGNCWELGKRTIDAVKKQHPQVRCIWGFSNTTFFHTPVAKLPPGMDGQSYHPYGTGTRSWPKDERHPDKPQFCVEGLVPKLDIRMPEGWAHTFIQTESLMRHLSPKGREARPEGTQRFYHYITEHGVLPPECGIEDAARAWELKTMCATRSFCMYLNKGLDVMHYFVAYEKKATSFGLLPVNLPDLPKDAKFEDVATPPMKAIRNLTRAFAGSVPVVERAKLVVSITGGGEGIVMPGQGAQPPLRQRDVVAVLPFQATPRKLVIPVYVMTYDATKRLGEVKISLTIAGVRRPCKVRLSDPVTAGDLPVTEHHQRISEDLIAIDVPLTDYPRLLIVEW